MLLVGALSGLKLDQFFLFLLQSILELRTISVVFDLAFLEFALKEVVFVLDIVDLGPKLTDLILFLTLKL